MTHLYQAQLVYLRYLFSIWGGGARWRQPFIAKSCTLVVNHNSDAHQAALITKSVSCNCCRKSFSLQYTVECSQSFEVWTVEDEPNTIPFNQHSRAFGTLPRSRSLKHRSSTTNIQIRSVSLSMMHGVGNIFDIRSEHGSKHPPAHLLVPLEGRVEYRHYSAHTAVRTAFCKM